MVIPFVRRNTSGEVPVLTRELSVRLGGSVEGATDREVQEAAIKANPMRMLVERECLLCGHEWQSPSFEGNCPKCHRDKIRTHGMRPCMAQRLK